MTARRAARFLAPALALLLLNAPRVAHACAVCSSGRDDETRFAFIWTTALLSVMPLLVLAGLAFWLRGKVREMQAEDDRVRSAAAEHARLRSTAPTR